MIVGFDFDNTLINYTNSFKKLAKRKKIVPEEINIDKISIRNYLRDKNLLNTNVNSWQKVLPLYPISPIN